MARLPRLEIPGIPLHIVQRGNNRGLCFFGDLDRRFYLKCLVEAAGRRRCAIHAYVLMSNHVHLLVTPEEPGAAAAMLQDVGRRYVRIVNTIHGRSGTLWEGRFKSSLVDSETYLMTCHRYIELNPVRAGLVRRPEDYLWSSHRHYAWEVPDRTITKHSTFLGLSADPAERRTVFLSLFEAVLDASTLKNVRDAVNTGSALGSEAFLSRMEVKLGRPLRVPIRGRPPKKTGDADRGVSPQSGNLF